VMTRWFSTTTLVATTSAVEKYVQAPVPRNKRRIGEPLGWQLGEPAKEESGDEHGQQRLDDHPCDADGGLLVANLDVAPDEKNSNSRYFHSSSGATQNQVRGGSIRRVREPGGRFAGGPVADGLEVTEGHLAREIPIQICCP